jgi:hypothetical protein
MVNRVIFRGRDVGYVDGNVYYTERHPQHVMQKFRAFGISVGVLDLVIGQLGVDTVKFLYKNGEYKKIFEYDIKRFLHSNQIFIDKTTDGKEDPQKFVTMEEQDWDEIKTGLPKLFPKKKDELVRV